MKKHSKSKEVQDIFNRALKALRIKNEGENPTYREVWDTIFDEHEMLRKETNIGGGLSTRPDFDENEIIEYMERSDKAKPSLNWYMRVNDSSGTYYLISLPSLLTKLKKGLL